MLSAEQEEHDENSNQNILDEIPEDLKKFVLLVAKTFYGREHWVVLYYIQLHMCIKEDDLRLLLKFDHRYLRTVIASLKVDKVVKERLIAEEVEGRSRKINYYHINYRAMLNVVKYKIDHMRQRLEVKDKHEVLKATYKCTGCAHHYDAMDMNKIFDPIMQELRCWRCNNLVEPDDTSGPSNETRSSLARFNEQMALLLTLLQRVDGIKLARHLVEPPIKSTETNAVEEKKVLQVGEQSFVSDALMSRSTLYQNGITVSIEGVTPSTSQITEKHAVPWLQAQTGEPSDVEVDHIKEGMNIQGASKVRDEIENLLISEFEETSEIDAKRRKLSSNDKDMKQQKETAHFNLGGNEKEDEINDEDDEEEDIVLVAGEKYYISEITPELVNQMTPSEKETYIRVMKEGYDY